MRGDLTAVLGVVLAAMILTELVTNVGAVALVFPVAIEVAVASDVDPKRMAIGVARGLFGVVSHPDRLPDQHHGLGSGALPVERLLETRHPALARGVDRHVADDHRLSAAARFAVPVRRPQFKGGEG